MLGSVLKQDIEKSLGINNLLCEGVLIEPHLDFTVLSAFARVMPLPRLIEQPKPNGPLEIPFAISVFPRWINPTVLVPLW